MGVRTSIKEMFDYFKKENMNETVINKSKEFKQEEEKAETISKLKYSLMRILDTSLVKYTGVGVELNKKYRKYYKELFEDSELKSLYNIERRGNTVIISHKILNE